MKCEEWSCPEAAESNLKYCRAHEGGFSPPFKGRTELEKELEKEADRQRAKTPLIPPYPPK